MSIRVLISFDYAIFNGNPLPHNPGFNELEKEAI